MEKKTLKTENTEKRKLIINKLVKSGINITPATLEFILALENPVGKVNNIIKEASFNPTFNGHLTLDILNKSSNESILRALKRKVIRQDNNLSKNDTKQNDTSVMNVKKQIESQKIETLANEIKSVSSSPKLINSQLEDSSSLKSIIPKEKRKINQFESVKSSLGFKPIAKEFETEFKIL